MKHTETILVVGASGTVGSELVRILKQQGHQVRTTTSKNVQSKNKENQVHVNFVTGEGLRNAFEGIDRAFLLSPSGFANQHAILSPLIQEAKRRALKKVVLMSAMGADAVETSPLRKAELELERSGLTYNIIRPNWFLQNFNSFWIQGIVQQNKILLPAGKAKVSFIDARDISAVAAKLLLSDEFNNQALDLTGPESVDHSTVAAMISKVSGKNIVYQEITPEDLFAGLRSAGLPEDYAQFLLMIFGALREGYSAKITQNVQAILQRAPLSLATYANDYQNSWK